MNVTPLVLAQAEKFVISPLGYPSREYDMQNNTGYQFYEPSDYES